MKGFLDLTGKLAAYIWFPFSINDSRISALPRSRAPWCDWGISSLTKSAISLSYPFQLQGSKTFESLHFQALTNDVQLADKVRVPTLREGLLIGFIIESSSNAYRSRKKKMTQMGGLGAKKKSCTNKGANIREYLSKTPTE